MRYFILILIISIFAFALEDYHNNDEGLSDWFVNEKGEIFQFKKYKKLMK